MRSIAFCFAVGGCVQSPTPEGGESRLEGKSLGSSSKVGGIGEGKEVALNNPSVQVSPKLVDRSEIDGSTTVPEPAPSMPTQHLTISELVEVDVQDEQPSKGGKKAQRGFVRKARTTKPIGEGMQYISMGYLYLCKY
ncbi:equilibrative nucleoside transporter 3 [Striga asiatica]|uniref:Equilibrative nucleoside transporter 3 n=1 Tax=Striga asiatica TaxID=4170 RepID=A0A5A7R227_STRAF|nr:equilibrative nucleoside transporter 3 [Striga asiatica]